MRPSTITLLALVALLLAGFWWNSNSLRREFERERQTLKIVGHNFQLLDNSTGEKVQGAVRVISQPPIQDQSGSFTSTIHATYVTGRWIGKLPLEVTVVVPGYKDKTVPIDLYSDTSQKLYLNRL